MRVPLYRLAVVLVEELPQHRQVVLLVVDRLARIGRRRPRQRGVARVARAGFQPFVVGNAPGGGAHDVEGVERRHAGPRFGQFDARVRDIEPLGGGARRHLQQESFGGEASRLGHQRGAGGRAQRVEQQRVFARLLREHPLRETGHEHHPEAAPSRLLGRADKQPAEPPRRRIRFERQQPFAEHAARLVQVDGTDVGHRPQVGEDTQNGRRRSQDPRRQLRKDVEPRAPRGLTGPCGQLLDDGEGKLLETRELFLDLAKALRAAAVASVLAHCLAHLRGQLRRLPRQPPLPARRVLADDCRIDQKLFPLPRRAERTGDDRTVGHVCGDVVGLHARLCLFRKRKCIIARREVGRS
jgi:hypothetical protein